MLAITIAVVITLPPGQIQPSVGPEVFATLLVADTVGLLELASKMTGVLEPSNYELVKKHMNKFIRLTAVSIGSAMSGLMVSTFWQTEPVNIFLLLLSAGGLFLVMVYSLDYIFERAGRESVERPPPLRT